MRFQTLSSSPFFFILGLSSRYPLREREGNKIMMEPSNLDHHHEELHGGSSSFPPPSLHLVGGSHDQWNPNLIVNGGGDFISSSRDFKINNETPLPIIQDLGFHWGGNAENFMNHSAHQSTSEDLYHLPSTSYIQHEHQKLHEMNEGLLGLHPQVDGSYLASLVSFAGNMSPSMPPSYSMSLGNMDLQPLDLLASARFGRSFCEPSLNSTMALLREENSPFGFSHLQRPCNSYHKVSTLVGGVTESKRGNNMLEQRASQAPSKKPRFEARTSFSPFKVRKEKLGDRIAALQQLVAPFGKTDTASVLMEAIGYIKFLHDQVEKLSVPYMRSSNNVHLRITQGASSKDKDEQGPDLRSRGLCLVPLSYTSFVTKRMEEFGLHQTNYEPM